MTGTQTQDPSLADSGEDPSQSGRCTARTKRGRCKAWPVHGATVCVAHGGAAPQVKAAAQRRLAEQAAQKAAKTYGLPVEIPADQALLDELHRTVGHVMWLGALIGDMGTDGLTQWGESGRQVSVWVDLYQRERAHLARVAKDTLGASIAERHVKLAEDQGALLAGVVNRILDALDLTVEQRKRVPQVVPAALRAVTGGAE